MAAVRFLLPFAPGCAMYEGVPEEDVLAGLEEESPSMPASQPGLDCLGDSVDVVGTELSSAEAPPARFLNISMAIWLV